MPRLLGKKLRHVRRVRGITQAELAQRLGIASQSHIAKVEAGEDAPSLSLVIRAAERLNVSTDYLLRDSVALENIQSPAACLRFPSTSFGERLRSLRIEQGLSQGELARRLGLASRAYIGGLEADLHKMPSLELVVRIGDLFGISTDDLLTNILASKDQGT